MTVINGAYREGFAPQVDSKIGFSCTQFRLAACGTDYVSGPVSV